MFGALKRGRFRSLASLILVVNVVGELQLKRTLAASRGFLAAARLSCMQILLLVPRSRSRVFKKCLDNSTQFEKRKRTSSVHEADYLTNCMLLIHNYVNSPNIFTGFSKLTEL